MLIPVLPLMFRGAVLDELALAACLPRYPAALRIYTDLRAFAAPRHIRPVVLTETHIAVNPVTHLLGLDPPKPPFPLYLEHRSGLLTPARKPDHLTVVSTTRVWASGGVIIEDIFVGDVRRVCEEDLGIGCRLMRKEHEKTWSFLVQDGSKR
jgi:hypothetical protein